MAENFGVLGQANPGATTLTDLFTVPAATQVVTSSLIVCNQNAGAGTFRVSVAPSGAADAKPQYLYRDEAIAANTGRALIIGMTLNVGDVVRVYGSSADFSFTLFGTKIT